MIPTSKKTFIATVVRYAPAITLANLLLVIAFGLGVTRLHVESGIKVFFDKNDPYLLEQELIERTYGKEDNILIVIEAKHGTIFTPSVLASLQSITEQAWQIPNSRRVDSPKQLSLPGRGRG
ncbi:MAG: hypothetical protein R3E50_04845 [Halioglobus sp.]